MEPQAAPLQPFRQAGETHELACNGFNARAFFFEFSNARLNG
ncbi:MULTISPECIES: hypothetical protein [Ottowia]|jgi:hypothetical protein|uniref:Uncharacterized protein n=1 Tax=Ottowia cancrivicina TaxID=3040346 RepID=A0AAW6RM72_9BURK|nr:MULTISPECIES: hypothetical protein [Ottowia]MDG9699671.1 hypothetical protein [Ottowia sp. 10c7w1]